jgi:hypothetical protein
VEGTAACLARLLRRGRRVVTGAGSEEPFGGLKSWPTSHEATTRPRTSCFSAAACLARLLRILHAYCGEGRHAVAGAWYEGPLVKSSQVNTLPNAKSQAKDKRAKNRQKHAALRCKVGVAPPGFEVRRRMSRVAFRVFPAGRAGDTRAAICAISCFVSRFRVCVCM